MADLEINGDGRPVNLPGLYRHPETGVELIARRHRKFGDAQADAFVQVGFKYVGPAPKEEPAAQAKAQPEVTEAVAPKQTLTKKEV